jgi:arylformamidase
MRYYDLSIPLSEATITWPGELRMSKKEFKTSAITSRLDIPSHFGTHIDAPRHFLFGKNGVDTIPLNRLIGKAKVITVKSKPLIEQADLQKFNVKKGDKILLKTGNSKLLTKKNFTTDYVSLGLGAARFLASKNIDLVGIDYLGIEAKSAPGHPVHKVLLNKGIVIIEGCDLSKVPSGTYNIAALPLKLKTGDGAPARVVLWK